MTYYIKQSSTWSGPTTVHEVRKGRIRMAIGRRGVELQLGRIVRPDASRLNPEDIERIDRVLCVVDHLEDGIRVLDRRHASKTALRA